MNLPYKLHHPTPRKLFIGPWFGEFGVELLRWQGIARAVARSEPWTEVVVACHPDRRWLYADFATRFCDFIPIHRSAVGRASGGPELTVAFKDEIQTHEGDVWLNPNMSVEKWKLWRGYAMAVSQFRNFGDSAPHPEQPTEMLIHARATNKANQGYKNWPYQQFEQLVAALPTAMTCASIGSIDGAHHITGTKDLRGIPLNQLAGYCATARLIVGPSSGPMHYAIHCGTPTVTWIGQKHLECYFPQFNPFEVPICCLPTWQPPVEIVLDRVHQILSLAESRHAPVKCCVFGTKRSGHHGFIEWMVNLYPQLRLTHLNDCTTGQVMTPPPVTYWLPSAQSHPKEINQPSLVQTVFHWNPQGRSHAKLLSYEGVPVEIIHRIPEVHSAERLIFVLRDAANLIASGKKGLPHLSKLPFVDPSFREILNVYRGYLQENRGDTSFLGDLASKAIFISYNRWHTEPAYRSQIAIELGSQQFDLERGMASSYAHSSGFESHGTPAANLRTLDRWKEFQKNDQFWPAAIDGKLADLEEEFHHDKTPLSKPWS